MASIVGENWGHVDGQDWPENSELSPRNHNLLMSLLDETQIDECDDERLTKVIQSLQDELDCADHYAWESDLVDCQSSIDDESCGQGFASMAAVDHLDHLWMDVEMMPTKPSGSDHMGGWCMDHHGQGVIDDDGGVNDQFGLIENNSSPLLEAEQDFWHGQFEYDQ